MAPARGRDPSVERTDEYEEFMADLEKYHELRGTVLEREPKIANRHLDLFRLYKKVTEEGGYDRVSDTKSNKLAWRRIAADFLQSNPQQLMTQAFLVKTVYYKNLAAYEIAKFHGKEPPPKEILEDLTAKGGNLMSRTVENFQAPRRLTNGNGDGSEASDDEKSRTPGEKMDVDEPSSGRATRGLRHAPPQRVLFQPDTSTARQTRQVSHKSSTPPVGHVGTPGSSSHTLDQGHRSHSYGQSHSYAQANGVPISNIANLNMAGFDPTQNIPSTVRPVPTPSNNSSYFRQLKDKILASRNINKDTMMYPRGFVPPGMGFPGPGIYQRCVMALRSGVRTEQEWALHHLVRMSNERGDKFVLHQFPNLAEALLEKVLEMTPLFYDTEPWEISYINTSGFLRPNELDGINGTADLLDKLSKLSLRQSPADTLYTREFSHDLERINEAALILRNMIMHPDNARYLSNIVFVKDVITIALNLPKTPIVIELKNYCLEMAEQLMQFFILGARDPLYVSLVAQLQSEDRGVIIAALNSLARNGLNYEATNRLENVPLSALTRINNWLLIEDEQLNGACLDFLYMYTAVTENVEIMVQSVDMHALISSMVRLLMFRAKFEEQSERVRVPPTPSSIPRAPPKLSSSILNQLAKEAEPERSSHWLRTSYMEQEGAETTQVDLWTAYNSAFQSFGDTLPAKNFITNTTATFPIANAQMSQTQFGHSKYVVQNLRPRDVAIDLRGRPYPRCLWHISADGTECGEFSLDPQGLWEHILKTHLPVKKDENDKWTIDDNPEDAKAKTFTCRWGGCLHFASQSDVEPTLVSRHIQTHLPDTSPDAAKRRQHNRDTKDEDLPKAPPKTWISTQTDARNEAEGLPLTSAFVLRNLARQLAKVDRNMRNGENQEKRDLVANYFSPFKEQLFYVFAYNRALVPWLERLLDVIATDAGWF